MTEEINGDCFEVAANIVSVYNMQYAATTAASSAGIEVLKAMDVEEDELMLVHGWVTRPTDGRRHEHGWVEMILHELVVDFSNGHHSIIPKELYYRAGCIDEDELVTYTEAQAKRMMVEHETYGPWEKSSE